MSAGVSDPFNAVITEVEPVAAAAGPLHGKRLLVKDLIDTEGVRTTYGSTIYADHVPARTAPAVERLVAAGAVLVGKANLHEFAWGVTSQNPWYGTVQNPLRPGRTTGGSSGGQRRGSRGRPVRSGPRHRHGLLDPAAGIVLRRGRAEAELGAHLDRRRLPALPDLRHRRADGADGRRRRGDVVGLAGAPVPAPQLRGLTVGLLTKPPSVGGPALPANRSAEQYVERLEQLGATVVEAEIPEPPEDTWPLFYYEAAESHRATFPSRAAEYGENVRGKLEQAQAVTPRRRRGRGRRSSGGARTGPRSTSTSRRSLGLEIPPVDCDELEVRLAVSAFLRPFNVLGWAGARDRRPAARRTFGRARPGGGPRLGSRLAGRGARYFPGRDVLRLPSRRGDELDGRPERRVPRIDGDPSSSMGAVGHVNAADALLSHRPRSRRGTGPST